MPNYDPLDRFLTGYRSTQNSLDDFESKMNPFNPEDRTDYIKAMQEMQMANITVDLALRSRNGLLKKALEKIA